MSLVLSIVIPAYNEEVILPLSIAKLSDILFTMIEKEQIHKDSYLLFVDDGSTDNSWPILVKACEVNSMVHAIKLSKNFGHNNALLAGLIAVKDRCDVAISIDCDLQQDPTVIPTFLEKHNDGADVVFGIRNDRKTDGFF